ncbi:MAG: NTP transferase domain-containing protein [Clostridia bacterium]|nr:NTP transferase domain-containing protein [Clostridia bacterium]
MAVALIVASGARAGRGKLEPWREIGALGALHRIVMTFELAGIARILVVCDGDESAVKRFARHARLDFIMGDGGESALYNARRGLAALEGKCDCALVASVDEPLFSAATVRALLEATGEACVPTYEGRAGSPVLLRADGLRAVSSSPDACELADALTGCGVAQTAVPVNDAGITANVSTGEDFSDLIAAHELAQLRPELKLMLRREQVFYGPGPHQLLKLTDEIGSLRDACRHMGISYSKGRHILSGVSQQLGCAVLESSRGGKDGGRSRVTEAGRALIRSYDAFRADAERTLAELFCRHFPD